MIPIITRNKPKDQGVKKCTIYNVQFKIIRSQALLTIKIILLFLSFYILHSTFYISTAYAVVDPLFVPNNRFGIHIIQATPEESSPAAALVNTNGDWGYITVLIESKDRKTDKWQEFFNDLRRRHLIPIVRLTTEPDGNFWKRPYEGEENAWVDFLDSLNWPTKNRYVTIYNEPNHGSEWGNKVDAGSYAEVLDKTITALKNKNQDFFVLNGGFDASTPSQPPRYEDELSFMKEMNAAVPGIFEKLDGWVSHSYPNPAFAGSPDDVGRGTVRTYAWELQQLRNLGLKKDLPVFITETGWKHAEGIKYDSRLPDETTVATYYLNAFEEAWNTNKIVAITPFLLNYQEAPFDHFSFKRKTGEKQTEKLIRTGVLGTRYPEYYSMYQTIQDLPKVIGKPIQATKAELKSGEIYTSIVAGETYTISLTFKNVGQAIWNDREEISLKSIKGGEDLGILALKLPRDKKVEPGQEYTFNLNLKAPLGGTYQVTLNLFEGDRQFDSTPVEFTTEVKSPVVLKIMSKLGWKKDFAGSYILKVNGVSGESAQTIILNTEGESPAIEARYLLPDYSFEFSLERPFYKPKTINQKVFAGVNTLDFGTLQPDIFSSILHPKELWKLLPFSN